MRFDGKCAMTRGGTKQEPPEDRSCQQPSKIKGEIDGCLLAICRGSPVEIREGRAGASPNKCSNDCDILWIQGIICYTNNHKTTRHRSSKTHSRQKAQCKANNYVKRINDRNSVVKYCIKFIKGSFAHRSAFNDRRQQTQPPPHCHCYA